MTGWSRSWGWNSCLLSLCFAACAPVQAGDWARFRGPNGSGIPADSEPVPTEWSPSRNVQWRTELPGAGVSSPIVVGNRVFVTCYSGYGLNRQEPGNIEDLKRHLICVDRNSGKVLWEKTIAATMPEDPYTGMGVPAHGYASHTPVSDGKAVYVFFGKSGALAFDMDGNQKWQTQLGAESDPKRWGSASSPILTDDLLVVTAGPESRAVYGLDVKTGKELWKAESSGLGDVWGTPILTEGKDGRTDIVIGAPYEVWGINSATGKLSWFCEAIPSDSYSSSVVLAQNTIFGITGREGGSIAIKAGGYGDISESHVLWTGRDRSRYGTPVIQENRLYYVSSGIATCLDATTGEEVYRARLEGGADATPAASGFGFGFGRGRGGDYSSPVLADGKVFYVAESGVTYVLKAGDQFEQLAANRVTEESENFAATPAISNGDLFIRSDKALYCISE